MTYQVTSEPTTTTNPDTGEQVTVPGTTERPFLYQKS